MKKLLLGVAAIGLSGCSWLGLGGQNVQQSQPHGTYYNQGQIAAQQHGGTWTQAPSPRQNYNRIYNQGPASWNAVQPPAIHQPSAGVTYNTASQPIRAVKPNNGCCVGGKTLSRWNVEAGIGPEFFIGGDAISGDEINDIPGVTSQARSFNDVYDPGFRYDLGASYALNPNRKVTANLFYANADGEETSLGNVNGEEVVGRLDDYERYGVEVGLRQYARPFAAPLVNSVRPYVEGKIGAARISSIDFENSDPNATNLAGTTPFYEGGWVPTGAGLVGIETPVFNRFTMGVETGIRYTDGPASDTSRLSSGVPLAGTNNGGGNWSVPVQIRGRYRF